MRDFFVLLIITLVDVAYYSFHQCIRNKSSYQDGNSHTCLGQSMVFVWAWYKLHEVIKGGFSWLGSRTQRKTLKLSNLIIGEEHDFGPQEFTLGFWV